MDGTKWNKRALYIALALLLCCLPLLGGCEAAAAVYLYDEFADHSDSFSWSGKVVSNGTQEPQPGMLVLVRPEHDAPGGDTPVFSGYTDDKGEFRFMVLWYPYARYNMEIVATNQYGTRVQRSVHGPFSFKGKRDMGTSKVDFPQPPTP